MILVVGGAGYIGSHMVKDLVARGERVVVLDNLSLGHRAAVRGAELVVGDLRDRATLDAVFGRHEIECVIHFAALASVGRSMREPEAYYDNNVGACANLLAAMRAHGVRRLIFSSSAATYGEPRHLPIDEEHPQVPTNPYGETKRVMEQMVRWHGVAHGTAGVALRYFNAAGADPEGELGEHHEPEEHLIPLVLLTALGRRPAVQVFGTDWSTADGTCVRDYVHVNDLCQAHYQALERLRRRGDEAAGCEAFNLGNEQGSSVLEVIETASRVVGRPIPWVVAPRRPGDPARLVASSSRAREVLGWRPRYDLATIVDHAHRWLASHPAGYV